jgi:hypothetical protein
LLVEETVLVQRLAVLVREQRARSAHAWPMSVCPVAVGVRVGGWWQGALRTRVIVWEPPRGRGTAARRQSARWARADAHFPRRVSGLPLGGG